MHQERFHADGQTEHRKGASCIEAALAVYERMFKVDAVWSIIIDTEREFLDDSQFKGCLLYTSDAADDM
eukprot:7136442-Prorocentrum_lima.AAC.1